MKDFRSQLMNQRSPGTWTLIKQTTRRQWLFVVPRVVLLLPVLLLCKVTALADRSVNFVYDVMDEKLK
jgi:hypothetical protein